MADSINPDVPYKAANSTNLTTMQEQATLALIEYIFEEHKQELKLHEFGIVKKNKVVDIDWKNLNQVQKVIFDKFPVKHMNKWDWMNSFYKQQALFMGQHFGGHTVKASSGGAMYSHYSQSDKSGFMQYITSKVKTKYGISKKDTWNPADIWLVWDIAKAKKAIDDAVDGSDDIRILNNLLRQFLYEHTLVGISLKMVGTKAKWETVNLMGADFTQVMPTTGKAAYKYGVSKISLPLDLKKGYNMDMQDQWKSDLAKLADSRSDLFSDGEAQSWRDLGSSVTISENGDDKFKLEIKSDHTSKAYGTDLKFEPKDVAPGVKSRLGRADKPRVLKLLSELSGDAAAANFNHWRQYPRTLEVWNSHKGRFESMVNQIMKKNNVWPIESTGVKSGKEFVDNVTHLFTEVRNLALLNPYILNPDTGVGIGFEFGPGIDVPDVSEDSYFDPSEVKVATKNWGSDYKKAKLSSDRLRFNVVSKLMEVQCYYFLKKLSEREHVKGVTNLEVWATLIAYMAQKKGVGFGPFGKIY